MDMALINAYRNGTLTEDEALRVARRWTKQTGHYTTVFFNKIGRWDILFSHKNVSPAKIASKIGWKLM